MIVSEKLRRSAAEAHCMLNIAGVCDMQGCVLCHIRLNDTCGMGLKPDDVQAVFGCTACHTHFDSNGRKGLKRGSEDWLFYALRGMARTIRWWVENGYISVRGYDT